MTIHMKRTFRTMLVVTVAGGLLVSGCAMNSGNASKQQQPKVDTSRLQPPPGNPQVAGNTMMKPQAGARAPQANPQSAPAAPARGAPQDDAYAQHTTAQQKKSGMFDWAWARKQEEPPVNTMERRVPMLNQQSGADTDMGMASYEAAVPVGAVDMRADMGLSPQHGIVVADEVIMMDDSFTPVRVEQPQGTYPSLASVPPRPERVDAIRAERGRMNDLEQARAQTYAQSRDLEAQIAADAPGSLRPQTTAQNDIDAEFAALVAADRSAGQPMVIIEDEPAIVVSGNAGMYDQAPAPITMAHAPAQDSGWQPAPLQPQTQPVRENEWVSLHQDPATQMAVPVEQVQVGAPRVAAVPSNAYVPDNMVGGIQLTPPSAFADAGTRALPESRYAARREAVYMQRYSRMQRSGY